MGFAKKISEVGCQRIDEPYVFIVAAGLDKIKVGTKGC